MNSETNYVETLIPLIVESVVIGILVNLTSDYVAGWLKMDLFTASLLFFLLLAVIVLFAAFRSGGGRQKPTELGGMLSTVFFARLLFLNCADFIGFDRWLLLGAGSAPLLVGVGMTGYLDAKVRQFTLGKDVQLKQDQSVLDKEHEATQKARQEAEAAKRALKDVEIKRTREEAEAQKRYNFDGSGNSPDEEAGRRSRVNIRSVIQSDMNMERQPGILFVIIESILSVKKTVTQMEILEVCRIISRNILGESLLELIRDLMGNFVNLRQSIRGVTLSTEDPTNWKITENTSYWKKSS